MSNSNTGDDRSDGGARTPELGRVPGDELQMIASEPSVLCSVQHPATRWIETTVAVDLENWR